MTTLNRPRSDYDVIVVGARAAGAATALLLAREGLRVLAVDRGRYGTDTLSTHALMRTGVLQLHRWGLLDRLQAAGTPVVQHTRFHYGNEIVSVPIKQANGVDGLYAPRRTVLDPILVDAAREAGADVRYGVTVKNVVRDVSGRVVGIQGQEEKGRALSLSAGLVVGADGMRSRVARAVDAPVKRVARNEGAVVYGYFDGVELSSYEWLYRPGIAGGLIPTNDGLVCAFTSTTPEHFRREIQGNLSGGFARILRRLSPEYASRVAAARQVGRFRGFTGITGYVRRPWGRGWALVGDASYFKDPITAHGISDALRDAELLARAVVAAVSNRRDEARCLADYERVRDALSMDLFEITEKIAGYDWTMAELRELLLDLSRSMGPEVEYLLNLDDAPAAA